MKLSMTFVTLLAFAAGVSLLISRWEEPDREPLQPGLEVYLGEGCIHCHSQYRRPVGLDTAIWGQPTDYALEMERQKPVVFGNRRQGPDLSNIGVRRSREWNRLHLIQPDAVRRSSRMPSYAHIFEGDGARGEALLDYLQSLGAGEWDDWQAFTTRWTLAPSSGEGSAQRGNHLYLNYCAGCHGETGAGDGVVAGSFRTPPRNLQQPDQWLWISPDLTPAEWMQELARLIKYGRAGTAMAGTEWLTNSEMADLIRFMESISYPVDP